jgi:hypothetical protein
MSVYDVASLRQRFDLVLFMGVLYNLRHPLLALDLIHTQVAGDMLICQSLQRGNATIGDVAEDYPFDETECSTNQGLRACSRGTSLRWRSNQLVDTQPLLHGGHAAQRGFSDRVPERRGPLYLPP